MHHELFIVEGVSAANALQNVCDQTSNFVYAVQGKPMNVERATDAEVRRNERVDEIYRRISRNRPAGIDGAEADLERPPFKRVILLTDGDVDGVHAKALLLVLIHRVMPELVEDGRLFTIRAPQFGVTCTEHPEAVFAYSPEGRQSVLEQFTGRAGTNIRARHYKGLASMDGADLRRLCVESATRRLSELTAEHVAAARAALD